MWKNNAQVPENFGFSLHKRTQKISCFHYGDFDFSIIFFSAEGSDEEMVTADSMECYAMLQRRLWESMKLVQLVFVLNNINLSTHLVGKKTQAGTISAFEQYNWLWPCLQSCDWAS